MRWIPMLLTAVVTGGLAAPPAAQATDPPHPELARLQGAIERYQALAAEGGWAPLPTDTWLEPDSNAVPMVSALLARVCHRLAITDDLTPVTADRAAFCDRYAREPSTFDAVLEGAVRRFQARHGLTVDGIVGPATVAALNVPVEARLRQLAVNADRWRATPADLGTRHVRVNIPAFELQVVEHQRPILSMAVVVGRPTSPTPVMTDAITHLVIRPFWHVPASITYGELLPKIAADPSYLRRHGYDVVDGWGDNAVVLDPASIDWQAAVSDFPYRLRQRPGRSNALGRIKFMFPNQEHIYLHDTNAPFRFAATRRAFSHGCVRVEAPATLAALLLDDDPRWSRAAIEDAMASGPRRVVPLAEPVPVHLMYLTAWVQDERVHFRADLYGHDATYVPTAAVSAAIGRTD